jgi:predicted ArsR family transcriptional regulator
VFQWHARFKTSHTSPGTVAQIQELIHQDQHWTIHDIAEEVGIGYGACQQVLTKELGMHHVAASP